MQRRDRDMERFWTAREACRSKSFEGGPPPGGATPAKPATLARGRFLLSASLVLALLVTPLALAGDDDTAGDGARAARGEGRPVLLAERNPGSGSANAETAFIVNKGNGGLAVRPSNTARGGRAISATCDNDGTAPEDGCAVYVNKGSGAAATFRTNGPVPFAIRETNIGLVQHLNADMVDGKHASELQGQQGPAGPQGAAGPKGEQGEPATKLWATVNSEGELQGNSGATAATRVDTGDYDVTFDRGVSTCARLVSNGAAVGDAVLIATNAVLWTQMSSPETIHVNVHRPDSSDTDSDFHLAVFC